ncbi:MAG: M24 family metallopeptidase [Alphaproteobacteria bacterium]
MNKRISKVFKKLSKEKVDYYLISSKDEYLNEYAPSHKRRLEWLINFKGSNGIALISKKKQFFFTDGRYLVQAEKEIDKNFHIINSNLQDIFSVIANNVNGKKILVDFKIFSIGFIEKLILTAKLNSNEVIHDKENLIDQLWINRPKEHKRKFFFLKKSLYGLSVKNKIKKVFDNYNYDYFILSSSDSICWLLNIRGYDLPETPVIFSKLILSKTHTKLFLDLEKVPKLKNKGNISYHDINKFSDHIIDIPKKSSILLDNMTPYYYYDLMNERGLLPTVSEDPCKLIKSKKNSTEIENTFKAHKFDGIALTKFFFWLDKAKFIPSLTELLVSKKLREIRSQCKSFFSQSFETISAVGSNGSIIHYNPNSNNQKLKSGKLYLCDSGAQYFEGTTDVTRTIHLGNEQPKKEFIENYTRVLMGHIDLAKMKFPLGTTGSQLDSIARYYLWKYGMDYDHGTGHGVGSFLSVHEGPQSISKNYSKVKLEEGMILSNEPGFYKKNKYGIRIESLVLVTKSSYKDFLEFKTLTLFPYERDLIKVNLLNNEQRTWINNYHSYVYKKLSRSLLNDHRKWLFRKTRTI